MQIIPILHNLRSTYNVGAILRTAEGLGVTEVIFSGYTPFPGQKPGVLPHLSAKLTLQIHKTALGAENTVKCTYHDNLKQFLESEIAPKAPLVALENNIPATKLIPISEINAALTSSQRVYLLLGEEVSGISPALYPYVTHFTEIPMRGHKESFNVSVAAAIALYELTKN